MPRLFSALCCTIILCSNSLVGQVCTGSLGENIFEEGDFGSGVANIPAADPGIAPGFGYQRQPPPFDGFYTITNDMRPWNNPWTSWRSFPDNSDDPNGYMMVVNAAFEPGLFYEQEVDGLCDGSEYQFSADITNIYFRNENGILPNVSFLIDGEVFFNTGNIPEDEEWHTYAFSFATAPGQQSVTLALRNNAPGGIGNDLAIDNIAFRACGPRAEIVAGTLVRICEDDEPELLEAEIGGDQYVDPAFQWQRSSDGLTGWADIPGANGPGYEHTEPGSGFYHYRYLLANGMTNLGNPKCRVVSDAVTVEVVPKRYEVRDTICSGGTYVSGGMSYTTAGTYVDTFLSSLGCDSVVSLQLTVVEDLGLEPDFLLADPSCSYLEDGTISLRTVENAVDPVRFVFAGTEGALEHTGLAGGSYGYAITDRYGCRVEGELSLRTPPPLQVELGTDRVTDLGESVRLAVVASEEIVDYVWSPLRPEACGPGCARFTLRLEASEMLRLEARTAAGCVAVDSVRILVLKDRVVYAPNVFSPNGDGINDFFTLRGPAGRGIMVEELLVFDRWGTEVFAAEGLRLNADAAGWNGESGGVPTGTGTYVFRAKVRYGDGESREIAGSFLLLR